MKKLLFTALLFGMLCPAELNATINEYDPITKSGGGDENGGPRGSMLSVQSSIVGDEMHLNIYNYVGSVQIMVTSDEGSATNSSYSINGRGNITLDFSTLSDGHYCICILFSDGTMYEGSFWKIND